jgi:uncharacterized delta-60 repeat protein
MIPTPLIRRAAVVLLQAGLLQLVFLPPPVAAAGDLDITFGGDGRVVTGFGGEHAQGTAVAIQADGKVVAAGTLCCPGNRRIFALARYNRSGALDPTFGGDGRVTTGFAGPTNATGVAIQADGKVVAVGTLSPFTGNAKFALARYKPSGALDPAFGGDGRVTTGFAGPTNATGVAIQADGKIVAAGAHSALTGNGANFALARYKSSGGLDPTFGGDGRVVTGFAGHAVALAVAIQADGKIVAAGSFQFAEESKFALARYLAA